MGTGFEHALDTALNSIREEKLMTEILLAETKVDVLDVSLKKAKGNLEVLRKQLRDLSQRRLFSET